MHPRHPSLFDPPAKKGKDWPGPFRVDSELTVPAQCWPTEAGQNA